MIRPPSPRSAIADGVITAQVRHALHDDPATADFDIHVDTLANVVELSGFVETTTVRDEALALARNVAGVQQVNDSMDIRRLDRP
jgi:osmotically-inducible protein OsmY